MPQSFGRAHRPARNDMSLCTLHENDMTSVAPTAELLVRDNVESVRSHAIDEDNFARYPAAR